MKQRLRVYKVRGKKARFHGKSCADGFREDRRHGLIYGPYCDENGKLYMDAEEASMAAHFCAYCG